MTYEEFVQTAKRLTELRKQKRELEEAEKNVKDAILSFMETQRTDRIEIGNNQAVSLQQRVYRRIFDLNKASRLLPPDVFQEVLEVDGKKVNEQHEKGRITDKQYAEMLVEEQVSTVIVVK